MSIALCIDKRMDKGYLSLIGAKHSSSKNGVKMLKCQICKEQVDILAHQIRDGKTVDACLDCADRYYQWFLTQELIASEKRGA